MADDTERPDAHQESGQLAPSNAAGLPEPDAEQWRHFQEFQRFQEYLRWGRTQQAPPTDQQPAQLHQQLTQIQDQLTQVSASQERAERELNPPLWKKILRSRWLHWLVVLVVVLLLVSWAYQYFFGGSDGSAAPVPPPRQAAAGAPAIGGQTPTETVIGIYHNVSAGLAGDACTVFTPKGGRQFATDFGQGGCAQAVRTLARQVTDKNAYLNSVTSSADLGGNGDSYRKNRFTVSSCQAAITGGPRLGAFVLRRAPNGTWLVAGHHRETCG